MKQERPIRIGKRLVGGGHPVFIIAEAGVNHNGRLDLALKLVDAAKKAGADAIKFQNFKAEEVTTAEANMAAYQKRNTGKSESQIDMIKKLELSDGDFKKIAARCKARGIIFLSAPHSGFDSVDQLEKLKVPAYKFGSADLNNLPTLQYAAKFKKPMIISTGMATLEDIKEAVTAIKKVGNKDIIVFQCTTDYPVKLTEVNIRAMQTIGEKLGVMVGYSDHTVGALASIAAVSLGARVLEKHLTLDSAMEGPDHKASANPENFAKFVKIIRSTETVLGSKEKTISKSSKAYMPLVLKSVVVRGGIKKGEKFTRANVAIKRPAKGLPPKFYFEIIGKRAKRNLLHDEFVKRGDYV